MDVLSCMEGKGRFYVNGPMENDLEYSVAVEGVGEGILRRQVYGENVRRVEVGGGNPGEVHPGNPGNPGGNPGKVQGTLFLPELPGPGVLCLSGAGGARVSFDEEKTWFWLTFASPGRHSSIFGWQRLHHSCSCLLWLSRSSQVEDLSFHGVLAILIAGAMPVFLWSILKQPSSCSVATAGKAKALGWLDLQREAILRLPWRSHRGLRLEL